MGTIAVLGTLDTKGIEHAFVADEIRKHGHDVILVDVGTTGEAQVAHDVTCWQVAKAAQLDLRSLSDRGEAVAAMAQAASAFLIQCQQERRIDGVVFTILLIKVAQF